MSVPGWVWVATVGGLLAIIILDLVVVGRRPRAVSLKAASLWVLAYVALALVFAAALWHFAGSAPAESFVAGYVTEYSLSVDNLFVFVILLARFAVPAEHQHKILLIGITLSLVFRALCIWAGAAAIGAFDFVFYIFGALLIYTAINLVRNKDEESDFHDSTVVKLMRRILPTSNDYDGSRLTTRVDGRWMLTPMVVVVLAIGVANVVFALDSIPAIFGLTQDTFIVFTANAFALMGLRQLYFLVGGLLDRLMYLSYGLAVILAFIGVKLIIEALEGNHVASILGVHLPHIGIAFSLGFIVVTLLVTTGASLVGARVTSREPR